MKRIFALALALLCSFLFCACNGGDDTKNKEVVEITITNENWAEYFEPGFTQDYFENNLGDITHMNCSAGIKLKDDHQIVLNSDLHKTNVDFEAELVSQFADVSFDFKKGTFEIVNDKKGGTPKTSVASATFTTDAFEATVSEFPAGGAVALGDVWQGVNDGGTSQLKIISRVSKVLNANGVLYLYK